MINVAEWLKDVGMTPGELADELGLPRGQISRFVVGEEEPDRLTSWALRGLGEHRRREPVQRPSELPNRLPKNPLAEELSDDTWTGQTARLALPIIVETAMRKQTLTYAQLHDAVASRGGRRDVGKLTKYSFPLGRIATAMQRLRLPPLTSIVVKASTGLPSSGIDEFIKNHLDLNRADRNALDNDADFRREKVQQLWDEVYAYENWTEVMALLGITGQAAYDL
ncbi:hypothetical protein [Bradyrhizobium sp. USDA 4469]